MRAVSSGEEILPARAALCWAEIQPVSVGPGSMAFTVMLRLVSSALSVTVSASRAAYMAAPIPARRVTPVTSATLPSSSG